MAKNKFFIAVAFSALLMFLISMTAFNSDAALEMKGYFGDVDLDGNLSVSDIEKLKNVLMGREKFSSEDELLKADFNCDGKVNVFDLVATKHSVVTESWTEIWVETPCTSEPYEPTEITNPSEATEPSETITTADSAETTEPAEPSYTTTQPAEAAETETSVQPDPPQKNYINASIDAMNASLPSQGKANAVIFYVDFPDCRYNTTFSEEKLSQIAFGKEDENNYNYPFESLSAFYSRSSKGAMELDGQVFRYTAKEKKSAYDLDKVKLAKECFEEFSKDVDFKQFDGNNDGVIDAVLFSVPMKAGSLYWWPCTSGFYDSSYRVDGMAVGNMITGNAEIINENAYNNFTSSYLHEMAHCMGLPDYYLYFSNDCEGMHGNAGTELMDLDTASDLGCFSKLMLGWYEQDQVSVYSGGTQEFILSDAQTDEGNCVIIPYGELDDRYFSEYFIIEYVTDCRNNSFVNSKMYWWQKTGNGIRIYHVKADFQEDYWFSYFKYQNGSRFTDFNDDGIRLIRLANDAEGGNVFKTGDVIDNNISGFNWYDENQLEATDPGVIVKIGELSDGKYTVTISEKNQNQ